MRVGVVIATVVIHAGVIGGLLVFAREDPDPTPERHDVDFDVVQPPPEPVPRTVAKAEPGPAPVRRTDPPRSRPQRRSARPPAPTAPVTTAPAPATHDEWLVADPVGPVTGDPAGGGSGSGGGEGGDGNGSGGGVGARDLSGPPVPLNATVSKTLPYTEQAARARVSGDVQLVIHVDTQGGVAKIDVRRGLGYGLDDIATKIAQGFTFKPATDRAGQATAGSVRWRFHFEPP